MFKVSKENVEPPSVKRFLHYTETETLCFCSALQESAQARAKKLIYFNYYSFGESVYQYPTQTLSINQPWNQLAEHNER